ncbi:BTB domain-containing protein [Mycena chlorophos]|uniref:BTB domain-containing protein n=1 Tax=Mycena chlorophos TaxID=658473 RepID=A0A8H6TSK6_MYCCL|nr:BTB domain-containing protein [Mycena chlorophos]
MDIDAPTTTELRRAEELWLEDGNIVLQAGNTQYRVHRSMLARHSPVFRDMLAFPQPADAELVDECPLVRLHDAEAEVTPFLRALFDTEFFLPFPEPTTFDVIYGCLRLSNKYDVPGLRRRALVHLSSQFRTNLKQHAVLVALAADVGVKANSLQRSTWPQADLDTLLRVVSIAHEVDAKWVLPAVFYHLGTLSLDIALLQGIQALSVAEQTHFLSGRTTQSTYALGVSHLLTSSGQMEGCASPNDCLAHRMEIADESQEKFGALIQDPLRIWTQEEWKFWYPDAPCDNCIASINAAMGETKEQFWSELPSMYGLPIWQDLETMRVAAIGDTLLA